MISNDFLPQQFERGKKKGRCMNKGNSFSFLFLGQKSRVFPSLNLLKLDNEEMIKPVQNQRERMGYPHKDHAQHNQMLGTMTCQQG